MRKIASIVLIVFFLVGIIGVNYDAHYCGGILVEESVALAPQKLSCGMHTMHKKSSEATFYNICCEDTHFDSQIDTDYSGFDMHDIDFQSTGIVPPQMIQIITGSHEEVRYECIGYSPPPQDLNILYQNFLI